MDQEGVANENEAGNNIATEPKLPESQKFQGRRSPMWKEFIRIDPESTTYGKERALCKHCKRVTFISNSYYGTTNMRKHLTKCIGALEGMKNGTNDHIFDQKVYRELVARAIIKHGYAFSWVEDEGNREIHAYLNNQCKSICRNTAKADCLRMHKDMKVQLKNTLHIISGRIYLTCDMWTSCQTEGYLCLTAHYVDDNWNLNSKVLNFCHIETPHTGKTMYNDVLALLQDWGHLKRARGFVLERIYKDYDTSIPTPSINANTTSTSFGNHKRKFDYFANYDDQEVATSFTLKSKLDVYLEDAKLERTIKLDILKYWKENEHRYGKLSHLARDILTVPITTVASESTFSIGGQILNKWRSSYLPENIEALITTRSWLFGYDINEDDEFVGCYVHWTTTKSR